MANLTTVTRPYAKAILELAINDNSYEKWSAMLKFLSDVAADPAGLKFINNLAVSYADKINFICNIAPDVLNQEAKNLVKILARAKRLTILPELFRLYEKMRMQKQRQVILSLTLAKDTDKSAVINFESTYASKLECTVAVMQQVEPGLIAGGIAQIDNRVVDASISGRLRTMRDLLRN